MNKLHSNPPTTSFAIHQATESVPSTDLPVPAILTLTDQPPQRASRIIVLVPESEVDIALAARRIWELANASGGHVQLLGLCRNATQEPSLRRQLVTISALVGDGRVSVESRVELGNNWLDIVKRDAREGDLIVCFAEQRAGIMHRPLNQILESNLKTTVYIISGLYQADRTRANWLSQAIAWIGSIGIMGLFFLLQIRIGTTQQEWEQTLLLILSVLGEIWLIWGWNSLFS